MLHNQVTNINATYLFKKILKNTSKLEFNVYWTQDEMETNSLFHVFILSLIQLIWTYNS